jgi:hypothetical protein
MKITQENAVRDNELKVLHIAVSVRCRWMIIEHKQDSGNEENDEEKERDRTEIIGSAHAEGLFANLYRHPVEEEIAKNGEAARAVGVGRAAAKDGLP